MFMFQFRCKQSGLKQCTFDWDFASSISTKCSTLDIEQLHEKAETKAIDGSQCRTSLHIGELTSEGKTLISKIVEHKCAFRN